MVFSLMYLANVDKKTVILKSRMRRQHVATGANPW